MDHKNNSGVVTQSMNKQQLVSNLREYCEVTMKNFRENNKKTRAITGSCLTEMNERTKVIEQSYAQEDVLLRQELMNTNNALSDLAETLRLLIFLVENPGKKYVQQTND